MTDFDGVGVEWLEVLVSPFVVDDPSVEPLETSELLEFDAAPALAVSEVWVLDGDDVEDEVLGEVCLADGCVVVTDTEEGVEVGVDAVVDGDGLFEGAAVVGEWTVGEVVVEVGVTPVPIGTFCLFCRTRSMSLIAWTL